MIDHSYSTLRCLQIITAAAALISMSAAYSDPVTVHDNDCSDFGSTKVCITKTGRINAVTTPSGNTNINFVGTDEIVTVDNNSGAIISSKTRGFREDSVTRTGDRVMHTTTLKADAGDNGGCTRITWTAVYQIENGTATRQNSIWEERPCD